ncbi:hypothetical protein DYQ86_11190 [Acidobacteria bacterium AB60]|nr:hypothetical protein DYQ86_11190 [Acidobacteria bacterium AB60]
MPPQRKFVLSLGASLGCAAMIAALTGIAQQSAPDALAGFNTPSFNSAASVSNGADEPSGDTFALDQQIFERNHQEKSDDPTQTGLGPVYNGTACVTCHENPNTGGASQITELRVGHSDPVTGNFVNPTIYVAGSKTPITGRSIVNDRATCPEAQEHVPDTENIRTLRAALNTLGDGFVEAIDDQTLKDIAENQPGQSNGKIHGEYIEVAISETSGFKRVGRFGWKDQHGSLLSFAADAYLNEMGVTNRFHPVDATSVCKKTTDPEDVSDSLGMADIDHFAQFIRATQVPPQDLALAGTPSAQHGQALFRRLGCSICHVGSIKTGAPDSSPNGDAYKIPAAIGGKIIHPYSDFLLHDIGTGDGIVQTPGLQETANKLRTAPLWGLRTKSRFMHDLKSLSLDQAIARHRVEASEPAEHFAELPAADKQDLLNFLNSL